jgi:hypothetical protein
MSTQGRILRKTELGNYEQRVTCSKIECCGSYGQLPAERMNVKKGLLISKRNRNEKRLLSCSQWSVHRKSWTKVSLPKAEERATSACSCRRVIVCVQRCSVQYKRVQPSRGHHCGRRRNNRYDSTSLLTLTQQLISGAVQGYWSTPDWSDRRQGCRQVSTSGSMLIEGLSTDTTLYPLLNLAELYLTFKLKYVASSYVPLQRTDSGKPFHIHGW